LHASIESASGKGDHRTNWYFIGNQQELDYNMIEATKILGTSTLLLLEYF